MRIAVSKASDSPLMVLKTIQKAIKKSIKIKKKGGTEGA